MDRSSENGQALIELLLGLFLVLTVFFFTFFAGQSSIADSHLFRFNSTGARP